MINRDMTPIVVLTYGNTIDDYGQIRQGVATQRFGDMLIKQYREVNVADPRFIDVELIGITKDKAITTKNCIKIGDDIYDVKTTIPSGKYLQVFMKKTAR